MIMKNKKKRIIITVMSNKIENIKKRYKIKQRNIELIIQILNHLHEWSNIIEIIIIFTTECNKEVEEEAILTGPAESKYKMFYNKMINLKKLKNKREPKKDYTSPN